LCFFYSSNKHEENLLLASSMVMLTHPQTLVQGHTAQEQEGRAEGHQAEAA
jgi:hypothetical protein